MQGKDVFDALKKIGVTHLHHANSVATSCTFLEQRGLLSRAFVEENKLPQTPQGSDSIDKKFGIWDRIFVDQVDIHARAGRVKAPNQYGPVLFIIDLEVLLRLPDDSNVLVTKENPIYWEGKPDAARWFENAEELAKGVRLGTFGQMIMIKLALGKLDFPNGSARVILDNPQRKLSSGEDAYTHGIGRLNSAASTGKIKASIECRQCQADCVCPKKYAGYKTEDTDFWFA